MNKKDIVRVFMDADGHMNDFNGGIEISWDNLVKGAMQLIEAEREACAKVCDENTNPNTDKYEAVSQYQSGCYITAEYLAEAIRARGQS
jgi:hypothetical protein